MQMQMQMAIFYNRLDSDSFGLSCNTCVLMPIVAFCYMYIGMWPRERVSGGVCCASCVVRTDFDGHGIRAWLAV